MVSSKEIFQFSLFDENFNLLFQVIAFICIIPMVTMKATILTLFRLLGSPFILSGHFKDRSSFICINT